MDFSPDKIRQIVVYIFVLVVSVALHEFGHAIMAHKLGDDTPSRQGRVTLNPLAHADPIGTFLLPLATSVFGAATGMPGGFGWGKPVQWQPHRVSRRISTSAAKILVAIAGPAMNLLLGSAIIIVHCILVVKGVVPKDGKVSLYIAFAASLNYVLFFFNLLPVPPLDGGHVAQSFMPYRHRDKFEQIARFSPIALLVIFAIPQIQIVFTWPADHLAEQVYRLCGSLFMK